MVRCIVPLQTLLRFGPGSLRPTPLFPGMIMTEKLSDYLKTAEAAEFLGVSQNTIRTWAKQDKIPVRVNSANGYRLFRQKDLQAFLDSVAEPASRKPK